MMTRLLITGSRKADAAMLAYAHRVVLRAKELGYDIIVGDAVGVDREVAIACRANGVAVEIFGITANPRHGERVGEYTRVSGDYLARDRHMVELCDITIAIWNCISRGTKYTYDYAEKMGKVVHMARFSRTP